MNIISNTTYLIDSANEDIWLFWVKETFIPFINQTNLCESVKLYKMDKIEEEHDNTYAMQLEFRSSAKMKSFNDSYKKQFDTLMLKRFGNSFTAFRTTLHEC